MKTFETQITSQRPGFSVNIIRTDNGRTCVFWKNGLRTRAQAITVASDALLVLRNSR